MQSLKKNDNMEVLFIAKNKKKGTNLNMIRNERNYLCYNGTHAVPKSYARKTADIKMYETRM